MELNSFLKELGIKAKKESQKIVVIRNHQLLPDKNIGRDLDLIIKEDSEETWINILKKICKENHLQIESNHRQFYCKGFKIKGVNDKNNYLYLDLNSRFNWRGIDFYSTDLLVKQSITFKDQIYTGKKNYINWYITFCHSFLYGGFINKKYLKEYRHAILENSIEFQKLFKIIPFKGLYWMLRKESKIKANCNIYPVPDLNVPFLGVHFTPGAELNSNVSIGPTANFAFGRENYSTFESINFLESI